MPVGDPEKWEYDPYGGIITGGRLYGVGACDMKAGLMGAVMAVKAIQDAGLELPGTVKFASVCDEEGGGNGSQMPSLYVSLRTMNWLPPIWDGSFSKSRQRVLPSTQV